MHLTAIVFFVVAGAANPQIRLEGLSVAASSATGGKYACEMAVDGLPETRWASSDMAPMPQWFELRFAMPVEIDTLLLDIPVDSLYAAWKEIEISFAEGDPVKRVLGEEDQNAVIRFEARTTRSVRVTVHSVYEARHYVGLFEIQAALDPNQVLEGLGNKSCPKPKAEIKARGRAEHPCVNLTPAGVAEARQRCEELEWAKAKRDAIVNAADEWLREDDAYWLQFLPKPGAAYAYGFTGDPSTNDRFGGSWSGARCSWGHPGQVRNSDGRWFPNEEYPDPGTGYKAKDGRMHYFVGIFNAWVTEQWTLNALPALSEAYLLTGDEKYAERGTLFLDALASIYAESTSGSWDYPSNPPSGRLARPWYQVARTLVKYVDQFDFMYNSPAMDKPSLREGMTRRENIINYMLLDGAYYCYEHSYDGALHNGHADYVRGALAVGCLLDIPTYIKNAVGSTFSIYTMLENNIDRDGRYYETALGYAIHARSLYLTFADPLYNLRNEEYPDGLNLYDYPKMQSALFLPELMVMMAGRMPNFGDAAPEYTYKPIPKRPMSSTDYSYLERLYARSTDPEKRLAYGKTLLYLADGDVARARNEQSDSWLLWHAAPVPAGDPELPPEAADRVTGSWVAGMKGMVMLRSDGQAVFMRFGPSLNHGDPDDLSLLYYANGYELSYDIGYGLGSTHAHVGWASSTVSHCLVTVDETNQFEQPGSGGSLLLFADLPGVKLAEATSELSYAASNVTEYRRAVALMARGGYLVDVFRVAGGKSHDYGFGSIGTNLEPFGVDTLEAREGSLAEGYDWGRNIGMDGDIIGYPDKPYWNPPPGNGYGFFFDVRRATPAAHWGGTWTIDGATPTTMRMHVLGDSAEAIFASAPGLYPHMPLSSYVIARRQAEDGAPLESTFLTVYEPYLQNGLVYDFDFLELGARRVRETAETKLITGLGAVVLMGTQPGDLMEFELELGPGVPPDLVAHCMQSPSYGAVVFEWDGQQAGEQVSLAAGSVQGPVAFPLGKVDTAPGKHTLTFRTAEGTAFCGGLCGISFGELPDGPTAPAPRLRSVTRLAEKTLEITRADGIVDIVAVGDARCDSSYGPVVFNGDFLHLEGDGRKITLAETVGCSHLEVGGASLHDGPGVFEATVAAVDPENRTVTLDTEAPEGLERLVAVFSNPAYSRTTAYHVRKAEGKSLLLRASTLALGTGRVSAIPDGKTVFSEITHEYTRTVRKGHSTRFFDGKRIVGANGGETRVVATVPGTPLRLDVEDSTVLDVGESFDYLDIGPGDTVRIAYPRVFANETR
ncbi:MAG TPA: heparinase II/III family protein [Candidatus Hydrogenedentes bacterium]|nr:heparinase II/III family protein [Candidatus Hydrogenedentota bacterium]HQE81711.1 heparinase II/III family protein [Candidatus Hydrogenedentota bacterium]HQH53222.1 heparinase II/III family protein [Candidatus Hydrogenedentota bacterium]HQM47869.1 heparinase II/III family protein [Candidatus Hydrogenedentota bacterium]